MTQLRCTLVALLGLTLAACGDDDPTVVAVNISYADGLQTSTDLTVQVAIEQKGETLAEDEFGTPLEKKTAKETLPDGGMGTKDIIVEQVDKQFFKRYEIANTSGDASVTVTILDGSQVLWKETTEFWIVEHGATAVYVDFEPPPANDTTEEMSSSAAPADAGMDSGTSDMTTGAASSDMMDAGSSSAPVDMDGGSDAGSDMDSGSMDASAEDASAADAG